jgi:hypothetical protein
MLTGGELALLSPLFGLLGVAAGTWATRENTRRQQEIDASQRRHDRRAEVYEDLLVELNRLQREQGALIAAGPNSPRPKRDERTAADDARWRARVAILAPEPVRAGYQEWTDALIAQWEVVRTPSDARESAQQAWLARMSKATVGIARLMHDDLEALSAPPSRPPARLWFRRTQS